MSRERYDECYADLWQARNELGDLRRRYDQLEAEKEVLVGQRDALLAALVRAEAL